ncbi:glycosyltransferase [Catovirus CTV1]|uniref:Glycosyltransferase n=1 Tax=Catovirus CTV1 TaxID=1977631 RepID=A0A1V0SAJ8_9VIRU|nr:glycosyltransferase [Catovirus CTV1]
MKKNQTICLNMIVKNESHVIEETLNSIFKYIDYYVIVDTGSTDNTKEVIKNFFDSKNINGEIIDHNFHTCKCHTGEYKKYNWFHFGWNRTFALNKCLHKSDYILIMDADDIIVGELPVKEKLTADSYDFKIGNDFVYYRPQLIKNDKRLGWKYVGGLHEYLDSSKPKTNIRLNGNYHLESRRLGNRSKDSNKYQKDAKIFEELLKDEPLNSRYMFYCGQSFFDCGDYRNAIKYYEKRVLRGGFPEEVYYSMYKIGLCKKLLNYSHEDIINAFLRCHEFYPRRVEPLYEIIFHCRTTDRFKEGYKYSKKALCIPFPQNDMLFVSKYIYDYKLADEVALCAYYIGKYTEAHQLWSKILEEKKYYPYEEKRLIANLEFTRKYVTTKPILCFYAGYAPDYTKSLDGVYGSELALESISRLLTSTYDVYIFGPSFDNITINNVKYMNSNHLSEFGEKNEIDVMIVSRYVHYFIEYKIMARKTYIWLHDVLLQPYWKGQMIPGGGKYLLQNIFDQINGVIVLCNWHKEYVVNNLNIDSNKVFIIGNGIETTNFNIDVPKIKNRFIYISNPNRGLPKLINHFHTIKKHIPDAELYVYRGVEEFGDKSVIEEMGKYDYIKFKGKLPNKDLIPEIMKAEYWYYPTDFHETYCISALEAQMAGCICITSKVGALIDTVADRGVVIDKELYSDEYWNDCLNTILKFSKNDELKKEYITKGKEWAREQTWANRTKQWLNIIQ